MIIGGALNSRKLVFDVGFYNAALSLKSILCARGNFFLVPPFYERIDIEIQDNLIMFTKHDGANFTYEDARMLLHKTQVFNAINPEVVAQLTALAQENLEIRNTLLFPDRRRTLIESSIFYNWARFEFRGSHSADMVQKVCADLVNYFPPNIKVSSNAPLEITIRTEDGARMLMTNEMLRKMAAVLVSHALLSPELHQRFILNVGQFALMQASRIYLHQTLHEIKDTASVGGKTHSNFASDQALRVLKTLAENGEFEALSDNDTAFLSHVQLFSPKEYEVFSGVHELKPFVKEFVAAYTPEIRALSDIRLLETGSGTTSQVGRDGHVDIIEGTAVNPRNIEQEERRRLAEKHQKKLED